jgi:deoxyxylulose-5-phosphate synthase
MCLPDAFIDHDTPYNMYEIAGLNSNGIVQKVKSLLKA